MDQKSLTALKLKVESCGGQNKLAEIMSTSPAYINSVLGGSKPMSLKQEQRLLDSIEVLVDRHRKAEMAHQQRIDSILNA
ncbi:hypothetical protein BWI93_01155 [Siphonobacter sp. BAB-5385]|uniref:hypothetical protein n=1 Tax=unclassified Siphonobacter TaxID=2635712 RepID=UPI000B9E6D96|nr:MULTISPECIES: hypothetical protein [unclassified Siphonobacter]OZI09978.1 hypothetical protein BWI93_01155 [Siphonobacter sp. BAB-5385]PMD94878.1 hypothetical protein BWI97_15895 [Siphonobacter sp. BAB-5405]